MTKNKTQKQYVIQVVYRENYQQRTEIFWSEPEWISDMSDRLAGSDTIKSFSIFEVHRTMYMSKTFEEDLDPNRLLDFIKNLPPKEDGEKHRKMLESATPMDFGDLRWKDNPNAEV